MSHKHNSQAAELLGDLLKDSPWLSTVSAELMKWWKEHQKRECRK